MNNKTQIWCRIKGAWKVFLEKLGEHGERYLQTYMKKPNEAKAHSTLFECDIMAKLHNYLPELFLIIDITSEYSSGGTVNYLTRERNAEIRVNTRKAGSLFEKVRAPCVL